MDFPYVEVFRAAEKTLIVYGSQRLPVETVKAELDRFKGFGDRELSDELCYSILVDVAFYSGFRAATVSDKLKVIHGHFPNWRRVAEYGETDIARILNDPKMIKNRRKIEACVENARVMRQIVEKYGSFQDYLSSLSPGESFENLLLLKEELEARFAYLGGVTVYHFLTEIGMDVLKPDRVIGRIFHRLGLIEYESQLLKAVIQGRKFAKATNEPIRYIDIVFVAYGQARSVEFGIDRGICLKEPRCDLCGLSEYCLYFREHGQPVT